MKRLFLVIVTSLMLANAALAATTTLRWAPGWDITTETLGKTSKVSYSINESERTLAVTFTLVSAKPNTLYQMQATFYCTTFPATFGQFPTYFPGAGDCQEDTRQGRTRTVDSVSFGVVTTDIHGDGSFSVVIGPIVEGTYHLSFVALDGAGCELLGGGGNGNCPGLFQSPGPIFGDYTTITIP